MKRAHETNQDAILDEGFLHHGGELSWSVFGDGRMTPIQVIERIEDAGHEETADGERGRVLMAMLSLVLEGWNREPLVAKVAERILTMAAAVGHWGGSGIPMPGVPKYFEGWRLEVCRRILDYWFLNERRGLPVDAKRVAMNALAMALYVNHGELEGWSQAMLGKACDQTSAGMMERVRRLCTKPVERSGGKARASFQQSESQREGSSQAQKKYHQTKRKK